MSEQENFGLKFAVLSGHEDAVKAYLALARVLSNPQFVSFLQESDIQHLIAARQAAGELVAGSRQSIQVEYGLKYP